MLKETEEKKFTQTEVNALVARARKELGKAFEKEIADRDLIIGQARERVQELEGAVETLTGERDTVRTELEGLGAQYAEVEGKHARETAEHRRFRTELSLTQALVAARVLPQATKQAVTFFQQETQCELNAAGEVVAMTYAGKKYEKLGDAAAAFLKANDHLASGGRPVGGGTRAPNASGAGPRVDVLSRDPRQLADEGWKQPPSDAAAFASSGLKLDK